METPWGPSQTARELIPGVMQVSTASHGGLMLSPERQKEARAQFPDFTPFGGSWAQLEEDCDILIGMAVWPEAFSGLCDIYDVHAALLRDHEGRNYYRTRDSHGVDSHGRLFLLAAPVPSL